MTDSDFDLVEARDVCVLAHFQAWRRWTCYYQAFYAAAVAAAVELDDSLALSYHILSLVWASVYLGVDNEEIAEVREGASVEALRTWWAGTDVRADLWQQSASQS